MYGYLLHLRTCHLNARMPQFSHALRLQPYHPYNLYSLLFLLQCFPLPLL
uniref:Uncharacterized protein n=1 Tax=Arundo donax TaxID=35708 RepID=A0A0A9CIQ9_ARUDO